jgi:hypothetical protein
LSWIQKKHNIGSGHFDAGHGNPNGRNLRQLLSNCRKASAAVRAGAARFTPPDRSAERSTRDGPC